MIDSFITYIERLELLTFFSGYPIIYAFVQVFAGKNKVEKNLKAGLARSLPLAYALVGTFFLLMWFREIYIQLGIKNLEPGIEITPLRFWGLVSVIFWFPTFRRKSIFSLVHSLVFFYLLCKDLLAGLGSTAGKDIITNDMKVYTVSILLNLGSLLLILLVSYLLNKNAYR